MNSLRFDGVSVQIGTSISSNACVHMMSHCGKSTIKKLFFPYFFLNHQLEIKNWEKIIFLLEEKNFFFLITNLKLVVQVGIREKKILDFKQKKYFFPIFYFKSVVQEKIRKKKFLNSGFTAV